ncbi:Coiled-coil domain-containing protein 3 [Aix galericulata]|nr:Coiled-coil domain-containing protein 3 [Aix galericulata]
MRFEKRSAGEFLLQPQLEGEQRVGLFSPLPSSFPGSFSPQPGAVHSPLPLQHLSPPSQPSETPLSPPQTPARTLGPGVAPQQVPLSGAGFWGRPFGISASLPLGTSLIYIPPLRIPAPPHLRPFPSLPSASPLLSPRPLRTLNPLPPSPLRIFTLSLPPPCLSPPLWGFFFQVPPSPPSSPLPAASPPLPSPSPPSPPSLRVFSGATFPTPLPAPRFLLPRALLHLSPPTSSPLLYPPSRHCVPPPSPAMPPPLPPLLLLGLALGLGGRAGAGGGCQLPAEWRPLSEGCRAELAAIIVYARVLALHPDPYGAYNYLPWQRDPPASAGGQHGPGGLFYSAEIELLCDQAWGSMLEVPAGSRLNLTGLGYFSCHSHTVLQGYSYFFFLRLAPGFGSDPRITHPEPFSRLSPTPAKSQLQAARKKKKNKPGCGNKAPP